MTETEKCWEVFECANNTCPVHEKEEPCCWLVPGPHPRMNIYGKYIEPMEVCLECKIFKANAGHARVQETFRAIRRQFKTYRTKVQKKEEKKNIKLAAVNVKLKGEVAEREAAEKACLNVNEELNSFIRTVSHDLKAPIISIQGFSARLLKTNGQNLGEKGREYLERIMAGADRMDALVLDLLQLAQVGETDCHIRNVSVGDIVAKVITFLEETIRKEKVQIIVSKDLPEIHCDENRLLQVFENLIVNAIKFTSVAEFPTIEIGYEDKDGFHQFHIRDNGIGIEPKYHQEIFEMFRQLKEINDAKGTGLGLTIVQRIVNRRGGQVWVDSQKGKGATFYFTLPKALRQGEKNLYPGDDTK